MNAPSILDEQLMNTLAESLSKQGYCILPNLLSLSLSFDLYRRVVRLEEHNALKQAGIGREFQFQVNNSVRLDETRWLSPDHAIDAAYLAAMSHLRLELNKRLFLGLFDYEAHYAHYGPGAFYKRHLDAFKGQSNRILTTVLYLNPDWRADDGGQLVLYHSVDNTTLARVPPELGTFVLFLSEQFPHEVLPCKQDRYSVSGWFRVYDPLQAPLI